MYISLKMQKTSKNDSNSEEKKSKSPKNNGVRSKNLLEITRKLPLRVSKGCFI